MDQAQVLDSENTKKDFVLLEKLGLMNPQEIKYTWELESDSLSFD